MNPAVTLIGPFGALLEVHAGGRVPVQLVRPSSEVTTTSGTVRVQRAARSSRRWRWVIPYGTDQELSSLLALEQGVFGSPPWRWYDQMAAFGNMLPAETASPGLPGIVEWWRWLGPEAALALAGPLTLADGRTVAQSATTAEQLSLPARASEPDPVPVIPGRIYAGSVQVADDTSTMLTLAWVDAAGAPTGTPAGGATAVGGRWSVTGVAPALAAGALVELTTDGRFAAGQLTEHVGPVFWQPGMGIPRVVISGGDLVDQIAEATDTRRDLNLELVEVGGTSRG